ncbi:hypothetical protein BB561_004307 [Smittium simulii]|uniref:Nuclear movement protein nudC n=1 Tax=Smittium simulii TaxID=133385 RepID=A0A2T9YH23_9FUNG|nr:hypothetical protein BB561_004307 [Smittium simulii]
MNSRGGVEDQYEWSQTLEDVTVSTVLPDNIKARDMAVSITPTSISVKILPLNKTVLEGTLHQAIVVDESSWSISSSKIRVFELQLEKQNKQAWWSCVVMGAKEIDTSKIAPENSKLSELPDGTRAVVEKMMFDQQQKALNKPTSEDIKAQKQQQILEQFKAQHPELDFSNAKIMK